MTINVNVDTLSKNRNSDALCVAGSALALPGAVSCSVIAINPHAITAECTNSGGNLMAAHTSNGSARKPATCTGTLKRRMISQPSTLAPRLHRMNSPCSRDRRHTRGKRESARAGARTACGGERRTPALKRTSVQRAHDSRAGLQIRQPKTSPTIDWIQ